jgi:hypothetical protein
MSRVEPQTLDNRPRFFHGVVAAELRPLKGLVELVEQLGAHDELELASPPCPQQLRGRGAG